MLTRLGRYADTQLRLVLCVLIACLPNSGLRLNLCGCHGIVSADACPCENPAPPGGSGPCCAVEQTDCDCCHAHTAAAERPDAAPERPDCGLVSEADSPADPGHRKAACCHQFSAPPAFTGPRWDGAGGDDVHSPPALPAPTGRFLVTAPPRLQPTRSTGPPVWCGLRRRLLERASVVLLI